MFCKKCGNEISEDAKFCPSCGESIIDSTKEKQNLQEGSYSNNSNIVENVPITNEYQPQTNYEQPAQPQRKDSSVQKKTSAAAIFLVILAIIGFIYSSSKNAIRDISPGNINWINYTATDGTFSAIFPNTPKVTSNPVNGPNFTATMKQYNYVDNKGFPYYNITVGLYNFESVKLTETQANSMLKAAINGMMDSSGWTLISSDFGKKGEYFTIDYVAKGDIKGTSFFVNGRGMIKNTDKLFIAMLVSVGKDPTDKDKFINSFEPK